MDYILESMDMFGTIAENLTSYIFNVSLCVVVIPIVLTLSCAPIEYLI